MSQQPAMNFNQHSCVQLLMVLMAAAWQKGLPSCAVQSLIILTYTHVSSVFSPSFCFQQILRKHHLLPFLLSQVENPLPLDNSCVAAGERSHPQGLDAQGFEAPAWGCSHVQGQAVEVPQLPRPAMFQLAEDHSVGCLGGLGGSDQEEGLNLEVEGGSEEGGSSLGVEEGSGQGGRGSLEGGMGTGVGEKGASGWARTNAGVGMGARAGADLQTGVGVSVEAKLAPSPPLKTKSALRVMVPRMEGDAQPQKGQLAAGTFQVRKYHNGAAKFCQSNMLSHPCYDKRKTEFV